LLFRRSGGRRSPTDIALQYAFISLPALPVQVAFVQCNKIDLKGKAAGELRQDGVLTIATKEMIEFGHSGPSRTERQNCRKCDILELDRDSTSY
jgi:hypothetical protein